MFQLSDSGLECSRNGEVAKPRSVFQRHGLSPQRVSGPRIGLSV